MEGWIKLDRKWLEHWLYTENRPKTRREAWEDMLLLANHKNVKVLIEGELVECKRGQCVMSLKSWERQFKWTNQKVRTFFNLLEKEEMILTEGLRKSTRVTICNYDTYQNQQQSDNNLITGIKQEEIKQINSNNNDKNVKTGKTKNGSSAKFNFRESLINLSVEEVLVDDWLKVRSKKKATNTETAYKGLVKQIQLSRLSANDCIKMAVENSWSGFNANWIENEETRRTNKNRFSADTTRCTAESINRRIEQVC